jgi:hypothetical protein
MGRPAGYQWRPLGLDVDPVPGDPGRISQEAAHLAAVARQIGDQVTALRKIGADNTLVGQYADKLRSSANDVADSLDKVVGRYQKVSAALNGWLPDLEHAQAQSIQALDQAEGPHGQLMSLQSQTMPSGNSLTPQQQQQVQAHQKSLQQASGQLDAARALLGKATTLRDNSGSYHAGKIRSAIDDGVKDSWWDRFKDFIDHYAWLIKDFATLLEWLATAIAIVALFIPGLDVLVALAIIIGAALILRTVLAATGNGSWMDVALDGFALLTLGAGKLLGSGISAIAENSKTLAQGMLEGEATLGKLGEMTSNFEELMGSEATQKVIGQWAGKVVEGLTKVEEETTLVQRFVSGGEEEIITNTAKISSLVGRLSGSPVMQAIGSQTKLFGTLASFNYLAALAPDWGDKLLGGIQAYGPGGGSISIPIIPNGDAYNHFKEGFTTEGGISTTDANIAVDVASLIPSPIQPFAAVFGIANGTW